MEFSMPEKAVKPPVEDDVRRYRRQYGNSGKRFKRTAAHLMEKQKVSKSGNVPLETPHRYLLRAQSHLYHPQKVKIVNGGLGWFLDIEYS